MKFQIKHRWSGAVLFELETDSFRLCVEAAVKAGANLAGADLAGADLARAYLARADLAGAKLTDLLTLVGERPVIQIGAIGSRAAMLSAYLTDGGVYVQTGCFFGTLAEFGAAVTAEHGDNAHGTEYGAAIALIEAHAALWTPKAETAEVAA